MEESDLAYLPLSPIEKRRLLERVSMLKVTLAMLLAPCASALPVKLRNHVCSAPLLSRTRMPAHEHCARRVRQAAPPGGSPAGATEPAPQVKPRPAPLAAHLHWRKRIMAGLPQVPRQLESSGGS